MKTSIDKKRLRELEKAEAILTALQNGGVDNWEFYDEAITPYLKDVELEERMGLFLEDIEVALTIGAYEPSERGAGFCASDSGREEAEQIICVFVNDIKNLLKE